MLTEHIQAVELFAWGRSTEVVAKFAQEQRCVVVRDPVTADVNVLRADDQS